METSTSKLVEKGTYGCAFSPPLPCKKTKATKKKGKLIGKVTTKRDETDVELSISNLVSAIPNYSSYFIVQEIDNCTPSNFAQLRKTYATSCPQIKDSADTDLTQLLSFHGGTDLHRLQFPSNFQMKSSLRHVLQAVQLLQKQGICHSDLHSGNLVRDIRGTLRILDFGSAFLGDTVSENFVKRYLTWYSPIYDQQPPEFTVLNAIHDGVNVNYAITEIMRGKKLIAIAQNYLGWGMGLDEQEDALRNFFRTEDHYAIARENPVEFFHRFWRKIDVWGVGDVFVKVLKKSLLSPHFIETQWKQDGPTIKLVLKGLLQCDPTQRLSVEKALELLG